MSEEKAIFEEREPKMKVETTEQKIEVIRNYMEKHDLTPHTFVKKHPDCGITREGLDAILSGKTKNPADQTILDLLRAIGWGTHLFPEP